MIGDRHCLHRRAPALAPHPETQAGSAPAPQHPSTSTQSSGDRTYLVANPIINKTMRHLFDFLFLFLGELELGGGGSLQSLEMWVFLAANSIKTSQPMSRSGVWDVGMTTPPPQSQSQSESHSQSQVPGPSPNPKTIVGVGAAWTSASMDGWMDGWISPGLA